MDDVTADDVMAWGRIDRPLSETEKAIVDQIVAAETGIIVAACVPLDDNDEDREVQAAAMRQAVLMQSFRTLQRRATPEGLVGGFEQVQPGRVSRVDPDVERLIARWDIRW